MRALSISVMLCCAVLVFPLALRSGWTIWWILSVLILVISGTILSKIQLYKKTRKNIELQYKHEDTPVNLETIVDNEPEVVETIIVKDEPEVAEAIIIEDELAVDNESVYNSEKLLSIVELIDLGFKEKYLENFHQAAYYFLRALALNPTPDLAICLIIDCYWLLNSLGERDYALTELKIYVQTYISRFNPELRHRFDTWIIKENLNKYFND